ncbi:hypothetical protein [Metallosphaera sp.]|uniref:hypothetical protein n=1 Tax=Metallosphaera sp. TaxID=2020860 RepID=UPI00319DD7AF
MISYYGKLFSISHWSNSLNTNVCLFDGSTPLKSKVLPTREMRDYDYKSDTLLMRNLRRS